MHVLAFFALLALPVSAWAQAYVGAVAGVGGANVPANSEAGGARGTLRLYGGYELTPHFAVEATALELGGSQSTIGAYGVVATFSTLPSYGWRFNARVGLLYMDARADNAENHRTTQPMLAIAAGRDILPNLNLGVEVGESRVQFGPPLNVRAGISWLGLAATYRF